MSRGSLTTELLRAQRRVLRAQRIVDKMTSRNGWMDEASSAVEMPWGTVRLTVTMRERNRMPRIESPLVTVNLTDADAMVQKVAALIEANAVLERLAADAEKPLEWPGITVSRDQRMGRP